jgi:general secretion pathway protein E
MAENPASSTENSKLVINPERNRDIYMDMVQRERVMFAERGMVRSTEQLLSAAIGVSMGGGKAESGLSDTASGEQLRAGVPLQAWVPLNILLVGLRQGILTIAPLDTLTDRQRDNLVTTVRRSGFKVDDVVIDLWDRAELLEGLRRVHDTSADRCAITLTEWLRDMDNGLLLNQFRNDMLAEALKMRASDIHILQDNDPETPNWIRYRIDGDLEAIHLLPNEAMGRLTTLFKRDSGLNFGDRTSLKDGRFSFGWQGRMIDVRVAAAPHSRDGEKMTMRMLDKAALKSFQEIFTPHPEVGNYLLSLLRPAMKGAGGFILLSGPTGSGKTSTLYAAVQEIDRKHKHVLSIEDPIEYEIRYATQWQVNNEMEKGGFADLIRAALRHDPDYIIIGEMRDGETVETAMRASESGHTVISTIHADSALQTLERLKSFIPPERERAATFTLAQQINCIMNQRLIRTLCTGCSTSERAGDVLEEKVMHALEITEDQQVKMHNPNGCDLCNRTGYRGRTLLLEALMIEGTEAHRRGFYEAMMKNVNDVPNVDGVRFFSRNLNLIKLVKNGIIDPIFAFALVE